MSTEPIAPQAPAPAAPQSGPETEPEAAPVDLAAELAKWKELAKKNEQRAKDNAQKAKDYDAFVESQKTEAQKVADRAAAAEKQAADAASTLTRYQVALRHGLSESDIEDLNWSGTDEEIEQRVQRFKERQLKAVRPSGSVDQGQRGGAPKSTPQQDFADVIARHMNRNG